MLRNRLVFRKPDAIQDWDSVSRSEGIMGACKAPAPVRVRLKKGIITVRISVIHKFYLTIRALRLAPTDT